MEPTSNVVTVVGDDESLPLRRVALDLNLVSEEALDVIVHAEELVIVTGRYFILGFVAALEEKRDRYSFRLLLPEQG